MHSIGSTKLAHVNTEPWLKLVTPLNPLHGYRDYVYVKKQALFVVQENIMGLFRQCKLYFICYPKQKCFTNI